MENNCCIWLVKANGGETSKKNWRVTSSMMPWLSWVTRNNIIWWVTLWFSPPLAGNSCVRVMRLCHVSGLCGFTAEFPSLFGDLMCQSIFLGWSLMGCLCFSEKHTSESSLNFCLLCCLISRVGYKLSSTLFTWKQSPALHSPPLCSAVKPASN